MENLLGVVIGVCLSAVCGFRVFVPLLGVSIAVHTGYLTLSPGVEWIGSWPALLAFAVATLLEIMAYYIPVVDNFMDSLATPAAVVAGVLVMAAMTGEMSPFIKWSLAIIAGGGAAGTVQASTVALRAAGQTTAPLVATPVMTTAETAGSIVGTVLAFIAPVLGIIFILGLGLLVFLIARYLVRKVKTLSGRNGVTATCAR